MNRHKFYKPALFIVLLIMSCTKVIDLKLGNDTGKLVIEANITNVMRPQYIKLSQNVPFTSTNIYPPVTGATVAVSDDKGNNYTFTEGPAGTYSSKAFAGVAGTTYKMSILTNGTSYTASSVMPELVALDSISSKKSDFNRGGNQRQITIHYKDPAGVANQYRFIMYVNGVQLKRVFVYNDDFTDGRYINIDVVENDIDIFPGDTAIVEMQCIDKPIYTYWYTLMQQGFNGPGGGVTPSNPPTNITPVSLGYFSAHTTQSVTIVVK
jgi:hypothetical protein